MRDDVTTTTEVAPVTIVVGGTVMVQGDPVARDKDGRLVVAAFGRLFRGHPVPSLRRPPGTD